MRSLPWREPLNNDADSDDEMPSMNYNIKQPPCPLSVDKAKVKSEQLRMEGNYFFKSGLFNEAIAKYTEALKANPEDEDNSVKCYRNMSICYSKKKDFRQAVDQAILAIHAQPTYALAYVRCGLAYMEMGKPTMAGVVFLIGLAILPNEEEINNQWQALGQIHKDEVWHAKDYCNNNTTSDIRKMEIEYDDFIKSSGKQSEEKEASLPDLIKSSGEESDNNLMDISNFSIELDEGSKPAKLRNLNGMKMTCVDGPIPPLSDEKRLNKKKREDEDGPSPPKKIKAELGV